MNNEYANPRKFKEKKNGFIFEVKIWAYFYFDILTFKIFTSLRSVWIELIVAETEN